MAYSQSRPVPVARPQIDGAVAAQRLLHVAFVLIPLIAGIDKFAMVLAEWDRYLAPVIPQTLGIGHETFMHIAGVGEILVGLLVAWRPRIGAWVLVAWFTGIIINLAIDPSNWAASADARFWDIGLRDVGLICGALALAWLTPMGRTENAQSSRNNQ